MVWDTSSANLHFSCGSYLCFVLEVPLTLISRKLHYISTGSRWTYLSLEFSRFHSIHGRSGRMIIWYLMVRYSTGFQRALLKLILERHIASHCKWLFPPVVHLMIDYLKIIPEISRVASTETWNCYRDIYCSESLSNLSVFDVTYYINWSNNVVDLKSYWIP